MKRAENFSMAVEKPFVVNDSRFGLRKFPLNKNETPTIATYTGVGRGPNGEHQN